MSEWTAILGGWECVDCGYVHPGSIDIHAHNAHVCGQLSIDTALADPCDVCGWYPGWGGDKGCGHEVPIGDVIPSRSTDPDTSHTAAREIRVKAGTQRALLLEAFGWDYYSKYCRDGLTDEQAMIRSQVSPTSEYAKRCSELREGGFIEPTGETRAGSAGPQRIVSRITDKGRAWIEDNR